MKTIKEFAICLDGYSPVRFRNYRQMREKLMYLDNRNFHHYKPAL